MRGRLGEKMNIKMINLLDSKIELDRYLSVLVEDEYDKIDIFYSGG